jgi:hypothetical protein
MSKFKIKKCKEIGGGGLCKKILAVLLLSLFLLVSCNNDINRDPTTTTTTIPNKTSLTLTSKNNASSYASPQTKIWKINWDTFEMQDTSVTYEDYTPPKLRERFYTITAFHSNIVGSETCLKWEKTRDPSDESEMRMVSFIKHFDITREKFDKANQEFSKSWKESGLDQNSEPGEIFNADLLYTFNNAKINDYYGRDLKKAAAADKWLEEWLKSHKPCNSYEEYLKTNSK